LVKHQKEHLRMDSRGYIETYIRRKYDHSTNLQNQIWITLDLSVQILKYLDWSKSVYGSWLNSTTINQISLTTQILFSKVSRDFFRTQRQRRQGTREERSSETVYWRVLGHRDALENGFKVIRTRARPISARVASMGDLLCLFTGAPPSGRGLTGNDTEILTSVHHRWCTYRLRGTQPPESRRSEEPMRSRNSLPREEACKRARWFVWGVVWDWDS